MAVTIRRISKFRQIARENSRGRFRARECDGLDISIQTGRHLPIETLDRAAEHDYDVSKEHQEWRAVTRGTRGGEVQAWFSTTGPGAMASGRISIG